MTFGITWIAPQIDMTANWFKTCCACRPVSTSTGWHVNTQAIWAWGVLFMSVLAGHRGSNWCMSSGCVDYSILYIFIQAAFWQSLHSQSIVLHPKRRVRRLDNPSDQHRLSPHGNPFPFLPQALRYMRYKSRSLMHLALEAGHHVHLLDSESAWDLFIKCFASCMIRSAKIHMCRLSTKEV